MQIVVFMEDQNKYNNNPVNYKMHINKEAINIHKMLPSTYG